MPDGELGRVIQSGGFEQHWPIETRSFGGQFATFPKDRPIHIFRLDTRGVGLGDFRPSRKGPFGRFSVVEWKITR